jgi:DNA-binding Xre family transcriptional regulator
MGACTIRCGRSTLRATWRSPPSAPRSERQRCRCDGNIAVCVGSQTRSSFRMPRLKSRRRNRLTFCIAVGMRIAQLRQQRGLTTREVARNAGMHHASYLRLERGQMPRATTDTLGRVLDALGARSSDLFRAPRTRTRV